MNRKPCHGSHTILFHSYSVFTDTYELIQEWVHLLCVILCNLDSRRVKQLNSNTRKVARLQLRRLHGERQLVDEVIRLVELCGESIGRICAVDKVRIAIRIGNLNHLSRSVCISNNGNVVTIALQLHYREGVSLVVLAEIRESFLVVFDILLYSRPAWTIIVSYVCNRNEWESVVFLFYTGVVVNSENLSNPLDSFLNHSFVNLLLESVELSVIPHFYPLSLFVSFFVVVIVFPCKNHKLACKRVCLRV